MRTLTFTPVQNREFQFAYESLLFPTKERLNRQEERSLAKLLDKFESQGVPTKKRLGSTEFNSYELVEETGGLLALEESEYNLLKDLVSASAPNGLWVRDKLALLDRLEKLEEEKVEKKDG